VQHLKRGSSWRSGKRQELIWFFHLYGGEPWENFRSLPEFDDVRDDPEFMQAARVETKAVL